MDPVQFNFKSDADKTIEYGLIAEEVFKLLPELVTYKNGEIHSVRYHLLVPLLLAELIRLKSENREEIAKLKSENKEEINKLWATVNGLK